jgi:hypothetical protein
MRNYIVLTILALSGVSAIVGYSESISGQSKLTGAILAGDIKSCKQASPDELADCLSKEAKQNNEKEIQEHHEPEAYRPEPDRSL